jgi:hypothetical protein
VKNRPDPPDLVDDPDGGSGDRLVTKGPVKVKASALSGAVLKVVTGDSTPSTTTR